MRKILTTVLTAALAIGLTTSAAAVPLLSGGFELGANVPVVSFTPGDAAGLGWYASNTDGERIQSSGTKLAAEGNYYASLLQNAGMYDGSALGIGDFGFTGFDRIYSTFVVDPFTTYTVTFQHAGDDRFGYLANTSVVEVVDADLNATLSQQFFATPDLFNWQTETFEFTSGANTNAALAFTVMGSGNTSAVFDAVSISPSAIPEPGTLALLGFGLAGAAGYRRRRANKA